MQHEQRNGGVLKRGEEYQKRDNKTNTNMKGRAPHTDDSVCSVHEQQD